MPEIATTPGQVTGAATNATSDSNPTTASAATPSALDSPESIFPYVDEEGHRRHSLTSLVTTRGNAHNLVVGADPDDPKDRRSDPDDPKARESCPTGHVFMVKCGHGNWQYRWAPCDRWKCDVCRRRRIARELVPEIQAAMDLAKHQGDSLKFVTLTWKSTDLGAQPTDEGRQRRRLDVQHFLQALRRGCPYGHPRKAGKRVPCKHFNYLRKPETHRSGKVHEHFVMVMPYIDQARLSNLWSSYARGAIKVDIEAAGMKCPRCWPGPGAPRKEKKRSMIYPPPAGQGECRACGYRPERDRDMAYRITWEIAKYIAKDPNVDPPEEPEDEPLDPDTMGQTESEAIGKMSRTKVWREWRDWWLAQHPEYAQAPRKKEACECGECDQKHKTKWAGQWERLASGTSSGIVEALVASGVAIYRQKPCKCFDSKQRDGPKAEWLRCPPAVYNNIFGLPVPEDD